MEASKRRHRDGSSIERVISFSARLRRKAIDRPSIVDAPARKDAGNGSHLDLQAEPLAVKIDERIVAINKLSGMSEEESDQ